MFLTHHHFIYEENMKTPLFIKLSALLTLSLIFIPILRVHGQKGDFGNIARYAKDNASLPKPLSHNKRVIFFGNSIVDCWNQRYPDFFEKTGYLCRGISGQTSYQFLLRFREDVINLQPALVVIGGCTNDIAENTCPYNEDHTMGNILSMVELAHANKIKVILSSVLPSLKFPWCKVTDVPAKITALNQRVKAYADSHDIPYVSYYEALLAEDGVSQKKEYTVDGVHPNIEGYKVMEKIILPVIKKNL